jgi:hypothetical protein
MDELDSVSYLCLFKKSNVLIPQAGVNMAGFDFGVNTQVCANLLGYKPPIEQLVLQTAGIPRLLASPYSR